MTAARLYKVNTRESINSEGGENTKQKERKQDTKETDYCYNFMTLDLNNDLFHKNDFRIICVTLHSVTQNIPAITRCKMFGSEL